MQRLWLAIVFLCLAAASLRAEPAVRDPFASALAEYYFRTKYKNLKGHKALAVGSYGVFGWSHGWSSRKQARNSALDGCRDVLRQDHRAEIKSLRCEVIAVDDELVVARPWVGEPLGTGLTGEDLPLARGYRKIHASKELKGIVLAVHGCDGLGWTEYQKVWGEFFASRDFDYYAPDSFADHRPAAVCGTKDRTIRLKERARDSTAVLKLRVAQTIRSIEGLKAKHPGVPIFVQRSSRSLFFSSHLAEAEF